MHHALALRLLALGMVAGEWAPQMKPEVEAAAATVGSTQEAMWETRDLVGPARSTQPSSWSTMELPSAPHRRRLCDSCTGDDAHCACNCACVERADRPGYAHVSDYIAENPQHKVKLLRQDLYPKIKIPFRCGVCNKDLAAQKLWIQFSENGSRPLACFSLSLSIPHQ